MRKHCWTGALCVLLCCACLAGCGLLDREYRVTKEHSDRYWESESADILRAESYDDVVSDLLILIGRHTESATLRLYQFPDDAAAAEALPELLQITLESGRTELTVRIGYWGEGSAALARKAVLDIREAYGIGDDVPWLLCCYPNAEAPGILEFRFDGGDGTEPESTLRFPDDGTVDTAG